MYNLKKYNNIRQWYYRGSLKSCNYSCSYCPFSKHKKCSMAELKKDEECLTGFVSELLEKTALDMKKCAVQIVPYGEALMHRYYWRELARLSQSNFIEAVGVQTNLSFDIDEMTSVYTDSGGIIEKLRLWCSFHPQMVQADSFWSQCQKLSGYDIKYCVGAAGEPLNLEYIQYLRERLSDNIYFFINKLDGLKRNYTADEIKAFTKIDEYFELELKHHKADISKCMDSLFVEADGTVRRCNICKPSTDCNSKACIRKECSCYLSYCNQLLPELIFFRPYPSFRIPYYPKAVFFDIDGTLIKKNSNQDIITDETAKWLKRLSLHSKLYFATSLPYSHAIKKAGKAKELFSGGVFAHGGLCRIYAEKNPASKIIHEKIFPLEYNKLGFLKENAIKYRYSVYAYGNNIYKITLLFNHCDKMSPLEKDSYIKSVACKLGLLDKDNSNKKFNIIIEDNCIQIISALAGKKEGIDYICSKMGYNADEIAVFGNSASDIPMLSEYKFSVAVNADKETKQAARYVII